MFIIYRIIIRYIIIPVVLNFLNRLFYKIFSLLRIKFKRLDWTNYRDKNGDWISIRRKAETIFRMYRVEREKKKNEQRVSINDRSIFYPSKFHLETWTTMPAAINCAAFYRSSVFIFPLPSPPHAAEHTRVSKCERLDSNRFLRPGEKKWHEKLWTSIVKRFLYTSIFLY